MDVEFEKDLFTTSRWNCCILLHIIVNEADDPNNPNIYYDNYNGKRLIIICDIPSLALKHGLDFSKEGMQNKLRGLAERYTDDDGQYLVSVLNNKRLKQRKNDKRFIKRINVYQMAV